MNYLDLKLNSKPNVVYKALFGNYESLNESLHVEHDVDTEYFCFTDSDKVESNLWKIIHVDRFFPNDPVRSSRYIKMQAYRFFEYGTKVLYIDNSVSLKAPGSEILSLMLRSSNLALIPHVRRRSLRFEFVQCCIRDLEDQSKLYSHYLNYKQLYPDLLEQKPYWGGMFAFRNLDESRNFLDIWFEIYSTQSRRDQLCILEALFKSEIVYEEFLRELTKSEFHQWPVHLNRKEEIRKVVSRNGNPHIQKVLNLLRYGLRFLI